MTRARPPAHLPARPPARSLSLLARHLNAKTLVCHTGRQSNCWSVCSLQPRKPLTSLVPTPIPSLPTWEITADFRQDLLLPLYQWINAYNGWKGVREKKITGNHHRRRLVKQFSFQCLRLVVALMNNKDLERLRETAKKQSKIAGRIPFVLVELVPRSNLYLSACFGPLFFFNHRIKSSIRGSVLIRCRSSAPYPPPSQLACFCPVVSPAPHLFTLFTGTHLSLHIHECNHTRAGKQPKYGQLIGPERQRKSYAWTHKDSELLDLKMKYKTWNQKPTWCRWLVLVLSLGGEQKHIYPDRMKNVSLPRFRGDSSAGERRKVHKQCLHTKYDIKTDQKTAKGSFPKEVLKNKKFSKSLLLHLICCAIGCNSEVLLSQQIIQKVTQDLNESWRVAATNMQVSISTQIKQIPPPPFSLLSLETI